MTTIGQLIDQNGGDAVAILVGAITRADSAEQEVAECRAERARYGDIVTEKLGALENEVVRLQADLAGLSVYFDEVKAGSCPYCSGTGTAGESVTGQEFDCQECNGTGNWRTAKATALAEARALLSEAAPRMSASAGWPGRRIAWLEANRA